MIHYAKLDNSPRLQRLLHMLSDKREYTTRDIVHGAEICAVNTAICELRRNLEPFGMTVKCRYVDGHYNYRLAIC